MERSRSDGAVAFRLVNELEGLLEGFLADRTVNIQETDRLRAWLTHNAAFASVKPFSELFAPVERALADAVLTEDECADLLFLCRQITPFNPFFDQVRSGLTLLMGIVDGMAADRRIHPLEIDHLSQWLDDWSHLKGLWPYDECEAAVTTILARKTAGAEAHALLQLARTFPVGGQQVASVPLVLGGICAVQPTIHFDGSGFVFTGESPKGDRQLLARHAAARGAVFHLKIRQDTDYLVVCDSGSRYWAFAAYGRKVEDAMQRRQSGGTILIISEADFWDAVADTPATQPMPDTVSPARRRKSESADDEEDMVITFTARL